MGRADWDEMFHVLGNERRRRLLVALLDHNPQHDAVAASDDSHRADEQDESQMQMYHTHLPTLEDAGYIRWDRDNHDVHKGPHFDEIRPVLELIENHKDELPAGWRETESAISK